MPKIVPQHAQLGAMALLESHVQFGWLDAHLLIHLFALSHEKRLPPRYVVHLQSEILMNPKYVMA
jgi:hypothetical protein